MVYLVEILQRHVEIGSQTFHVSTPNEIPNHVKHIYNIPASGIYNLYLKKPSNGNGSKFQYLLIYDGQKKTFNETFNEAAKSEKLPLKLEILLDPINFLVIQASYSTNIDVMKALTVSRNKNSVEVLHQFTIPVLPIWKTEDFHKAVLSALDDYLCKRTTNGVMISVQSIAKSVKVFDMHGAEHFLVDTLSHGESVVIYLDSLTTLSRVNNWKSEVQWTEMINIAKPPKKTSVSNPPNSSSNQKGSAELSAHTKPVETPPSTPSTKGLDKTQKEIKDNLSNLGIILSDESIRSLSSRSSSAAGAINYYFENLELFPQLEEVNPPPEQVNTNANTINLADNTEVNEEIEYDFCGDVQGINHDGVVIDISDDVSDQNNTAVKGPAQSRNNHNFMTPAKGATNTGGDPIIRELSNSLQQLGVTLSPRKLKELSLRSSTIEGMLNYYWSNQELFENANFDNGLSTKSPKAPLVEKECMLCFDTLPMESMYTLNCYDGGCFTSQQLRGSSSSAASALSVQERANIENHRFCIQCLARLSQISLNGSEDTPSHIPACPLANDKKRGCKHVLEQTETLQILELACELPDGPVFTPAEKEKLFKKAKKLYLTQAYYSANCVRCPSCPDDGETGDGSYWISLPNTRGRKESQRIDCPKCKDSFCSACEQAPYHYGCKCDEVMTYARNWLEWQNHGRAVYLQELRQKDEEYNRQLQKLEKEHAAKVKEQQARFKEALASEEQLAKECKQCPYCGCRITKISGCDHMTCGADAHGTPRGAGCGRDFSWSSAPPYHPNLGQLNIEEKVVPPEKAHEVQHLITLGVPLPCEVCNQPIVGPCISCLHCPSLNVCLKCSTQEDFGRFTLSKHDNRHICKVIFESQS